jgi:hypothetical protein
MQWVITDAATTTTSALAFEWQRPDDPVHAGRGAVFDRRFVIDVLADRKFVAHACPWQPAPKDNTGSNENVLLKNSYIGGSGFAVGLQWVSGTLLTPAARMRLATQDENVPGHFSGFVDPTSTEPSLSAAPKDNILSQNFWFKFSLFNGPGNNSIGGGP